MIGCDERRPVVLSPVDQPGGKAGEDLAIGHLDGFRAERPDHLRHQLRLLHTDAQALEVGERANRPDAVVDRSRAGIIEGETDESVGLEAVEDFISDRAVKHLLQMLDGPEQKRHRQHIRRRDESSDQRHVGAVEIDGADARLLDGFLFFAELARMEHAYLQPAARTFLDEAAHIAKRLNGRIVFALSVGGAKFARENARGRDCTKQRDNHG